MVAPEDVVHLCQLFSSHAIRVWLCGGWGIDALLGEPTRTHKDLDVLMLVDDVNRMCELLSRDKYDLKEIWSENLWTLDQVGVKTATAFVLRDQAGRELDAHAMRLDPYGNGVPAWDVPLGFIFTAKDLSGTGLVNGYPVACQSAENQMACHTGYDLPDHQWGDLDRLHEKYGVEFPAEISSQRTVSNTR